MSAASIPGAPLDVASLVAAFRANKCAETAQAVVDAINAAPALAGRVHHATLVSVFRHAGVFAALERERP